MSSEPIIRVDLLHAIDRHALDDCSARWRAGQTADADLHTLIDPDANSIAIIVKHVSGNLRSRFADFLTTDGEKPDRDRDGEFEMPELRRARDAAVVERGLARSRCRHRSADAAGPRAHGPHPREPFLVSEALNRSVTHTAYHVGQIVLWQALRRADVAVAGIRDNRAARRALQARRVAAASSSSGRSVNRSR